MASKLPVRTDVAALQLVSELPIEAWDDGSALEPLLDLWREERSAGGAARYQQAPDFYEAFEQDLATAKQFCAHCGTPLIGYKPDRLYGHRECKEAAYRKRSKRCCLS